MDRLADLQLFLRVLDLGSISAAARSSGLSPALASQHLQRLERSLGVRLFHRTTRRLRVTPEGAALAAQGRPLVEGLEALSGSLRRAASDITGSLRVSLPASFGRQYISPLLPAFVEAHPRLKLQVDLSDERVDLVRQGFDLAIRIGALPDSGLVARRLADNRRVLCAAPEYLRRRGVPDKPAQLREHECLLLAGSTGAEAVWTLRDEAGAQHAVRVRGRLESNFGEVLRDAALAGLGIAQHSTWHVCEDLRAGRLVQVLPKHQLPESGIHVVMPQRRMVLPRVRAFIQHVQRVFGVVPPWERHLERTP
ncbi:MAG: LysR family transcriptional regulator [Polyangiales bacterium]